MKRSRLANLVLEEILYFMLEAEDANVKEPDPDDEKPKEPNEPEQPTEPEAPAEPPEASVPAGDSPSDKAHELGLHYKGHGYWADKSGQTVARTVQNHLVKLDDKNKAAGAGERPGPYDEPAPKGFKMPKQTTYPGDDYDGRDTSVPKVDPSKIGKPVMNPDAAKKRDALKNPLKNKELSVHKPDITPPTHPDGQPLVAYHDGREVWIDAIDHLHNVGIVTDAHSGKSYEVPMNDLQPPPKKLPTVRNMLKMPMGNGASVETKFGEQAKYVLAQAQGNYDTAIQEVDDALNRIVKSDAYQQGLPEKSGAQAPTGWYKLNQARYKLDSVSRLLHHERAQIGIEDIFERNHGTFEEFKSTTFDKGNEHKFDHMFDYVKDELHKFSRGDVSAQSAKSLFTDLTGIGLEDDDAKQVVRYAAEMANAERGAGRPDATPLKTDKVSSKPFNLKRLITTGRNLLDDKRINGYTQQILDAFHGNSKEAIAKVDEFIDELRKDVTHLQIQKRRFPSRETALEFWDSQNLLDRWYQVRDALTKSN